MGGPDMAPQTRQRSEHPGEAVALLDTPTGSRRRVYAVPPGAGLFLENRAASPLLLVALARVGRVRRRSPPHPGPDALQEAARPNELGREDSQAERNDDQCRPGQDDHRSTDQEHRAADHRDRDPPRALQHGVKTAAEAPAPLPLSSAHRRARAARPECRCPSMLDPPFPEPPGRHFASRTKMSEPVNRTDEHRTTDLFSGRAGPRGIGPVRRLARWSGSERVPATGRRAVYSLSAPATSPRTRNRWSPITMSTGGRLASMDAAAMSPQGTS